MYHIGGYSTLQDALFTPQHSTHATTPSPTKWQQEFLQAPGSWLVGMLSWQHRTVDSLDGCLWRLSECMWNLWDLYAKNLELLFCPTFLSFVLSLEANPNVTNLMVWLWRKCPSIYGNRIAWSYISIWLPLCFNKEAACFLYDIM